MTDPVAPSGALADQWLTGGGEMGKLIRSMDWSRTALGPIESWPQSLRTTVSLCLASNFPISIAWGPERTQIYNDGYWPICGEKHPTSMGQDFRECWLSAWPAIGEAFERATAGETAFVVNRRMFLDRHGYLEETFFTFSFSPIRDESGGVGGLFHPVTELTQQTLAERRLEILRDLAERAGEAKTVPDAYALIARTLGRHQLDLPFLLLYELDAEGARARRTGAAGIAPGSAVSPEAIELPGTDAWPLTEALAADTPFPVRDLARRFGRFHAGPYPEPPDSAMLLPIRLAGVAHPSAVVVAGVSARRPLDDPYRTFYVLLAEAITIALTSARAYEEERRRAEALAELDRAKTLFFSNVSHEFRTPLTLMLGPIESMLQAGSDLSAPEARTQLEVVHRNGLRMLKLVNTLLDFSRIEAGRVQASYEPVDLAGLTADLAGVFRAAVERAGLRYVVDCAPLAEPVYVDRDMWEKIVLNLLSNAFKITLQGEIAVRVESVEGAARLIVHDTGVGIPAEEIPRVFERFHRVAESRGRTHEGTGIGLALVRELVRLHGGAVTVESEVDRGSRFMVTLPLGAAHLDPARVRARVTISSTATGGSAFVEEALRWLPEAGDQPGVEGDAGSVLTTDAGHAIGPPHPERHDAVRGRVVFADDNADMRLYVSRLLRDHHDVRTVADGEAALQAVRSDPPDLVLADVIMPKRDGFGLLRGLRDDPALREIPVILLSARAGEEARVGGLDAGADDYLVKPFAARELLSRVDAHIRMARIRRSASQALRASEERYRAIVEGQSEMVCRFRPDGTILFVNGAYARARGTTPEALAAASFWDFIPESDRASVRALLDRLTPKAPEVRIENRFETSEGVRWTLWTNRALSFDGQGRASEVQSSGIDITDRKRAEDERQRFVRLVEESSDFIGMATLEGRGTYLNPAGAALVGWRERREITRARVPDFYAEASRRLVMETALPTALREGHWSGEVSFRHFGTGRSIPMLQTIFTIRDSDTGEPVALATVARDISERKVAEQALRERERRFRAMANAAPAMLWMGDPDGTCSFISRAWCEYTGQSEASALGLGWLHAVHPDDREAVHLEYREHSARVEAFSVDYRLRRADGEYRWVIDASRPRFSDAGDFLGYVGSVIDVHERKLAEEALREADQRKDEFLAMLAHELRNPLAPMRSGLEVIRLAGTDWNAIERARAIMQRQLGHMVRLIDDLLDVSRINRGKIELRRERVDLALVVEDAVEAVRPLIDDERQQLEVRLPDEPVLVDGDPARLGQVFANLLNNASKFSDPGGRICLEVACTDGVATVTVADEGAGIPARLLPRVFDLFMQGAAPKVHTHGGLGLGLTLVKRLVDMHGGLVEARSEGPGRGAQFIVRLPALLAGPDPRPGGPPSEPSRSRGHRILVVDDNVDAAESLAMTLTLRGHETRTAFEGEEALAVAAAFEPDVVLLDIGMPGIDGLETARRLRARGSGSNVLLVAVTGWGNEEDKRLSREAGFDLHLVKPVEPDVLESLLSRVGARKSADSPPESR